MITRPVGLGREGGGNEVQGGGRSRAPQGGVGYCEEFAFLWLRLEEVGLLIARDGSGLLC